MKKSHSFDVLSDRECQTKGCTKKIKQRLVSSENNESQNKKFETCFRCHSGKEFTRRSIGTKR